MRGYDETLDKVALAVESAKLAKAIVVKTEGIGEDLNFSLMGWCEGDLVIVAQLSSDIMADHEQRFDRVLHAACIMRRGWQVTALTLVAEGYCSTNADESKGKDMAQLFASPDADFVRECLSFTHAENGDAMFVAVPYSCFPPRSVQFGGALQHRGIGVIRDTRYPVGLLKALEMPVDDDITDGIDTGLLHELLAKGIMDLGFEVNYK